ncbi:Type 1 glutamine amidotransferase-like domain-containing protein [Microbacterium sp. 10M-3C3]|jgi:dipeptidase E|uniref:Type 1 glutamine amidotransferase-like domain-containing protein n=1 Tax=Microbacterium sp. 10M-3C3 TaxID=2483401 RepID=UPI000F637995|nr:Type 1 glutamine amidotransferase-like domain-containing protein [Microbacterium sp. 10M-3C3]
MKMLLTSGGVTNASIRAELVRLLEKPIEEADALVVPTAQWGQPMCSPQSVWRSTAGAPPFGDAFVGLGWRTVGVLELAALRDVDPERWRPWVEATDVILADGGEAVFLAHRMREVGLDRMLPDLDVVWVGVSAGSMVMTPRIGPEFVDWRPGGSDETLGLVDFSIFPHLDYPGWESNTTAAARRWAAALGAPAFAIDEQTAISVVGSDVRVVSEGNWEAFAVA